MRTEKTIGEDLLKSMKFTGTMVNYYHVCKRKLWFLYHTITMEQESELVALGKSLSRYTYPNRKHEINIDQTIVLDWIDWRRRVIHEVKRSNRMRNAHRWQVKYYLYYLEKKGVKGFTAILNYPRLRQIEKVTLSQEDKKWIPKLLRAIFRVVHAPQPPSPVRIPPCKKCAYYEFCWI
jgi:CRISPR-associated exonuclease Cas4